PDAMESTGVHQVQGLGVIAANMVLSREKTTRQREATLASRPRSSSSSSSGSGSGSRSGGGSGSSVKFAAYEIHLGVTRAEPNAPDLPPFAPLDDGPPEGLRADSLIGTYLHGAFEPPAVCREIFGVEVDAGASKAQHYDRLAAWFDQHCR